MAIMIPERPRELNQYSREDIMFNALEKLPDDYYVVHSFEIDKVKHDNSVFNSEADFVIFNRTKGILCVEAKAGRASYKNGEWYYGDNITTMHSGGPFAQARRSMYAIQDYMKDHGLGNIAEHCKFLHAVWFPSVPADYIRQLTLPPDANPDLIMTEEALYDPEPYLERIFALKEHGKEKTDINEKMAARVVNEVLCPQFSIAPSASFETDTKHILFHRLLKEQASVLNFLDEQKTAIINGAAGTGKTLVALEKAKRHAQNGEKVLFLCFNAQLKNHLAENYANEFIDFYTIAGYACKVCRTAEPDYDMLNNLLMEQWEQHTFPYQHVIVDEGQDFGCDAIEEADVLDTLKAIIEDKPNDGSFYVFYDKLQLIQARKLPKFISDADCKLTLYRNCRNTENIAKASLRPVSERTPKLMENCIVGLPVKLHFCESEDEILVSVDDTIDSLHEDYITDIVILTCKTESDSVLTKYLENGKYPAGKEKIRFTTCRKFKGLEADAVILVDVDEQTFTGNDGQNVLLYYVGASRARLRLDVVTQMNDSECVDVLQNFGKGNVKKPKRELAKALNAVMHSGEL